LNSLERSLQAGLVVSLVFLMFVFWWAGSLTSRLLADSFVFSRLELDAGDLLTALDIPEYGFGRLKLGNTKLNPAYRLPHSGKYFIVRLEPEGDIASRSAWDQRFEIPQLAPGQQKRVHLAGTAGEPLLLWLGGFSKSGYVFTIGIAEDITPIRDRLSIFQWYFAGISLLLLIALLVVQHLIVSRSIRKLDKIHTDMNRLEHGLVVSLSEDVPSEIMPLVREFNRLLLRFDQRLRQSRNAVGNLAHSLKGPLNLLLRSSEASTATPAINFAIQQNAERIRQLIESELKRARLAGRGAAGQLFDLDAELPALAGLLAQVYSDKDIDVRYRIGPNVELMHDRQDMLELIGNLLDNAVKWARSRVIVTVRSAEGVLLDVDDDGPGCSEEELSRLTTRGVRLDESVAGHGLGLSIVKDIVEIYGGKLELGRSNRLGGLRASVYLPDRRASDDTPDRRHRDETSGRP